ncbi:TPA: GIY-YIG nuclease family protein [Acinetobacter baumannii]|uniref:GIY-YIG nuclease family protein n=1 Tax=Acinetobacter baumannii TaxID=470 RepID=UPI00297988A2|nr:GIY-YIG nuclease family protein [Acinetobacter baumannii]HAV5029557.1 GIY-YIG nuclease family protein [Acinetobacter baumannii]
MGQGKSVKLFLADGTPNGILTAEIINWTGHVLSAPRSKLAELIQREECTKTGVYFLISHDPENPLYPRVYIGESDDVANRLKQHNRTEESGGKDFWEKVCLITSKDQNLTKSHIKYLESRLMDIAKQNGQCQLENGTAHNYSRLPESDIADMEFFLEQIQIVLPVLGYDFLKDLKRPSYQQYLSKTHSFIEPEIDKTSNFYLSSREVNANAQEIDGEFFVLKGSQVRKEVSQPNYTYMKNLRPTLFEKGIIDPEDFVFTQDYMFTSPSAASAVILGRASNGRTAWREVNTNLTYSEWQQKQVDSA